MSRHETKAIYVQTKCNVMSVGEGIIFLRFTLDILIQSFELQYSWLNFELQNWNLNLRDDNFLRNF